MLMYGPATFLSPLPLLNLSQCTNFSIKFAGLTQ
jgi:hypothetical protein